MLFLYRFDVLRSDGALTETLGPDNLAAIAGSRTTYLHTNYERDVVVSGSSLFGSAFTPGASPGPWTFTPLAIEHDGIRLDSEKVSGQITVSLPADHPLARLFVEDAANAKVSLSIAMRYAESAAAVQPVVIWTGIATSPEFDEHRCRLTLDHVGKIIGGTGLTERHPRLCPHALYDRATCKVDPHAFDESAGYWRYRDDILVARSSLNPLGLLGIYVPDDGNRPDGFFSRGYAVIEPAYSTDDSGAPAFYTRDDGLLTAERAAAAVVTGGVRRGIEYHRGGVIELTSPLPAKLLTGTGPLRVTLYAGCAKTLEACQSLNPQPRRFGGHRTIPILNVYERGLA